MTIMMRIFKKKKTDTKGIVEARIASDAAPAGEANGSSSALATFSNPFGLGQSESLVPSAGGDYSRGLQQGIGKAEANGTPAVQAVAEDSEAATAGDEAWDELHDSLIEPQETLAQVEQPEAEAEMQDKSSERPINPFASIWGAAKGRASSSSADPDSGPLIEAGQGAGNGEPRLDGRDASLPLIPLRDEGASQAEPVQQTGGDAPAEASMAAETDGRDAQAPRLDVQASQSAPGLGAQHPSLGMGQESPTHIIDPESELPRFSPVSAGPPPRDPLDAAFRGPGAQTKLWEAFTPSRPKYSSRFFAGRRWALQRIITAVEQDQAHIIIYGPRGIGKTSLANVLAESASEVEYQVLRFPCGSNATYEEIFRGLLSSLPADHLDRATQARFSGVENLEQLLPKGQFGPTDVTAVLSQIKLDHAILIIDEFDRVESKQLKNQLAETIKNLSDASARVTFIVIGIAHSLDELIGMHPSIQRHLVGIHLPLMTEAELEHVILAGEDASGIRFEDATRDMVVAFSKGLPYFAQLLSLHAGRTALRRGSMRVQMADLRDALELVLIESDPLARASYDAATREETDQLFIDVLFAAATARFDEYGTFTADSAVEMFMDSEGKERPEEEIRQSLEALAQQEDTRVIETWPTPTDEVRYTFVLQTMRQYILLRQAVRRGLM